MPAFPTGVYIDPERSRIIQNEGFDNDRTNLNLPRLVRRRARKVTYEIVIHGLTDSKRGEILTFIEANRASNEIQIEYDGATVTGRIINLIPDLRVFNDFYEISFQFVARVLSESERPIILAFSGQSNGLGVYPVSGDGTDPVTMTLNENVYDWQSELYANSKEGGGFRWVVADPDRTTPAQYPDDTKLVTGMRGEGVGNMAWFAADKLQRELGRDVYIIQVNKPGAEIEEWSQNTDDAIETELSLQVQAALAALPFEATTVDYFGWMQGESNLSQSPLTTEEYASEFNDFITTVEPKWLGAAQIFIVNIAEETFALGQSIDAAWKDWDGLREAANDDDSRYFIPSTLATTIYEGSAVYHYDGPGLKLLGNRIANKAIELRGEPLPDDVWIMATGQWNDTAQWRDDQRWSDG